MRHPVSAEYELIRGRLERNLERAGPRRGGPWPGRAGRQDADHFDPGGRRGSNLQCRACSCSSTAITCSRSLSPPSRIMRACLRIQVNANHRPDSIKGLLAALQAVRDEFALPGPEALNAAA